MQAAAHPPAGSDHSEADHDAEDVGLADEEAQLVAAAAAAAVPALPEGPPAGSDLPPETAAGTSGVTDAEADVDSDAAHEEDGDLDSAAPAPAQGPAVSVGPTAPSPAQPSPAGEPSPAKPVAKSVNSLYLDSSPPALSITVDHCARHSLCVFAFLCAHYQSHIPWS